MDIAVVSYEWPGVTSNCGGGGRIGARLVDELRQRGHTVSVITDETDGHYTTFPARQYRTIKKEITEFEPDVVHGLFSLPSSLPLPRITDDQTPLVTSVMGADLYDPTRYQLIRPVLNLLNNYIFSRSTKIVSPSTDIGARLPRAVQPKSKVIRYGIDSSEWPWRVHGMHRPRRILTVCRLIDRKNILLAYRAIKNLRDHTEYNPEWRIVGSGPLAEELNEQFQNEPWIELTGYAEDLTEQYHWADLFYLPSKHEAFGIVFLEALACGLPVVTSDTGGQVDILEPDEVGLAAPPTRQAQSAALQNAFDNHRRYQQRTRGYVQEHFSLNRMADEYERTYRSALNEC